MTAEQQAITALQRELVDTRTRVQQLVDSHEALKSAHGALNIAAQNALAENDMKMNEAERRLRQLIFRQQFDLLDAKELKPDKFRGRATEPFKPRQRKFKAFCNSKRSGFRAALEWAEAQTSPIHDPSTVPWDSNIAAAPKLQDFLLQILDESALLLIDKANLNENGWESWRLLVQQYAPSGGAYELDSMMALMAVHQFKS